MYNLSKQHDTPNELQTFVKGKEHKNIPSITGYTNHKNESDKKKKEESKKEPKTPFILSNNNYGFQEFHDNTKQLSQKNHWGKT